jgi:hypothetical protein
MRNVSMKAAKKTEAHILCSKTFFPKIVPFLDNVENYCTVGQATDDNMAQANFFLDT